MATFIYTALNVDGKERKGQIDAPDTNTASAALRTEGLFVVSISDERRAAVRKKGGIGALITDNLSISKRDLVFFFKQLAFMLRAGLPMLHALNISKNQFHGRLARIIQSMIVDIEAGSNLSTAMKKYKTDVFPPIAANMVLAGESTGSTDAVTLRLAKHLEKKLALRSQTVSAMIYPMIVVFAAIAVVTFLLGVIIPKFAAFLVNRGKQLPAPTQLLIDMSNFVINYGVYIIGVFLLISVLIGVFYTTPRGRLMLDTFLLKIPVIGKLLLNSALADFSWSLSMMLNSGLTAYESLNISSKVIGNRYISDHLARAAEKIKIGKDLASSIQDKMVPDLIPQMITVGEQTGSLDQILDELGGYYEERLEEGVKRMSSLIEPVLILVIGVIVGFVYYAFFMALFSLVK